MNLLGKLLKIYSVQTYDYAFCGWRSFSFYNWHGKGTVLLKDNWGAADDDDCLGDGGLHNDDDDAADDDDDDCLCDGGVQTRLWCQQGASDDVKASLKSDDDHDDDDFNKTA